MNTYSNYPKGSEWRKWDLHFHAPSEYTCAKNDQYEGADLKIKQDVFIEELKKIVDISVIGITDYFSLDGFKMVISKKEELEQFDLILPNIELRITPVTNSGKKINLHLLPNTEVLSIDEIERFLHKFEFGPDKYTCKKDDLIKLGRKSNSSYSEEEAFKKGLNEFAISYDKLFEEFNLLPSKLKDNILIGVSNNSGDGASGIKDIQGIRDVIYSGVDFIFSSQPADRQYFLGNGADNKELIRQKYGNLKPCLHGSDYHGSKNGKIICMPDLNRFCWIKADSVFEGLKQVIYEPEERVAIQVNKPEGKTGYQIIEHIKITSELIFNSEIFFNPNLNSIIGGRSSGKSVLLGAISKKVKSSRFEDLPDDDYQVFVQSIADNIKIIWKDGEEENDREVEYFEQGYMYKIARDESYLNKIINDILIQEGKETVLEQYKKFLIENSKYISGLISDHFGVILEIKDKEQKARDKGDKKGIEEEISKLKGLQKELTKTEVTTEDVQEYEQIEAELNENNNRIQILSKDIETFQTLRSYRLFKDNINYEFTALSEVQKESLFSALKEIEEEAQNDWVTGIDDLIRSCGSSKDNLSEKCESLKTDTTFVKVTNAYKNNIQLSEYNAKIKVQTQKLFEITTIFDEVKELNSQLIQTREKIRLAHKLYYDKILEIICKLSDSKDDLEIKAKWKFDSNTYRNILQSGLNLQGNINQYLVNYQFSDFASFEGHQLELFERLENNRLTLKGGFDFQRLSVALLSTNFFILSYDIEYEGDNFMKMSDGKKAFVVLKLLLDFSDKDCPILIDQPEDDLDNRAIYNDLVKYIRNKKKQRQIIVATHNPNIVVGADSELIICANQHGEKNLNNESAKFQYVTGSLEHTFSKIADKDTILESQGTREHVCELLEGGNIAFKLREKKYSIKE